MFFVGLDLAWGSRDPVLGQKPNRTGIAVLNADGQLVHLETHRSDEDIYASVAPYIEDSCLVAIDAPLKITNQKSQRLAETTLGRDFGGFDAGANSANIERFSADPRGARLARALDLDIDPRSKRPRRAIEVYPHPATVALFQLRRIFKFKKGTPAQRRPQMLSYIQSIENLATSPVPMYVTENDVWNRLRQHVERAQKQFELDYAEDQIDAVMCAYVALYASRRPHDVTIYGDFPANGYILTPTLPPGLKPKPRQPARTEETKLLSHRIAAEHARCARLMMAVHATWTEIENKVRELDSIPSPGITHAVLGSLTRAESIVANADQALRMVRDQLSAADQSRTEPG